ncbi:MAG: hypothetical protein M1834_005681 [Cirrosporium novae-zelandiae]|nr:MAG: hypothetical protein M1834_005681 [Cirrosporium novae-zelandiae]
MFSNGALGLFSCGRYGERLDSSIPQDPMENANKSLNGVGLNGSRPSRLPRGRSKRNSNNSPSANPSAAGERPDPFSRQNRRLQLRNAGFHGSFISTRKISPNAPSWPNIFDENRCPDRKESSGCSSQGRIRYGEDNQPASVSILQEISNSTQGRRQHSLYLGSSIFQYESTEKKNEVSEVPVPPWYSELFADTSPTVKSQSVAVEAMKSHPASLRSSTPPPLRPPLTRRTKLNINLRSASLEAAKYIEYLENQLTAIQTQQDLLPSPRRRDSEPAQLRALASEVRILREEVEHWESQFDERVREEVDNQVEGQSTLKAKLQSMEKDMEIKENRVKELEREVGNVNSKLKDMEGLEATNRGLERRVDVLTELLAQTPIRNNRATIGSERSDTWKSRRPRSMMPKFPSSPATAPPISQSFYPPIVQDDPLKNKSSTSNRQISALLSEGPSIQQPLSEELGSIDSGIGRSCSSHSVLSVSSNHPSTISDPPITPSAWGLPLPSSELKPKSPGYHRKMRKFLSGSGSLKPLVLPVTSGAMTTPSSAPPQYTGFSPYRNISESSLDPVISFLSHPTDALQENTPTHPTRQRFSPPMAGNEFSKGATLFEDSEGEQQTFERSLDEDTTIVPIALESEEFMNHIATKVKGNSLNQKYVDTTPLRFSPRNKRHIQIDVDLTPRPLRRRPMRRLVPSTTSHKSTQTRRDSTRHFPSSTIISKYACHLLSNYTSYIAEFQEFRKDPFYIARQIIANAWYSNWRRLGHLSWWILGLLLGSKWRDEQQRCILRGSEVTEDFDLQYPSSEPGMKTHAADGTLVAGKARKRTTNIRSPANAIATSKQYQRKPSFIASQLSRLGLWAKFSVALVLVIGVAIKEGPQVLLSHPKCPRKHVDDAVADDFDNEDPSIPLDQYVPEEDGTVIKKLIKHDKSNITNRDFWGMRDEEAQVVWTKPLGVEDFETIF